MPTIWILSNQILNYNYIYVSYNYLINAQAQNEEIAVTYVSTDINKLTLKSRDNLSFLVDSSVFLVLK